MTWEVVFHEDFEPEFDELSEGVQNEMFARASLLEEFGPQLGRPWADTLNSSRHANMKELRFDANDGVWRVAFAFPNRQAILLVCGDKSAGSEKRFYRGLINKADRRFDKHLAKTKKGRA